MSGLMIRFSKSNQISCSFTTVIAETRNGPLGINRAAFLLLIKMLAITVRSMGNEIGRREIPAHDAFFHVLLREREWQFAAGRLAKMHAVLAINLRSAL